MKIFFLFILIAGNTVVAQCVADSSLLQPMKVRHRLKITECGKVLKRREVKSRLERFEDSRKLYKRYVRGKIVCWTATGLTASFLAPVSFVASMEFAPAAGSLLILPIWIPTGITTGVGRQRYFDAICAYNSHFQKSSLSNTPSSTTP